MLIFLLDLHHIASLIFRDNDCLDCRIYLDHGLVKARWWMDKDSHLSSINTGKKMHFENKDAAILGVRTIINDILIREEIGEIILPWNK